MRYQVRDRDGAYGVWDSYLLRWMINAFDMSIMSETDADHLAFDLNANDEGI